MEPTPERDKLMQNSGVEKSHFILAGIVTVPSPGLSTVEVNEAESRGGGHRKAGAVGEDRLDSL